MKDSLEEFIRQNRSAFDDREPSDGAWERIRRSIGRSRRLSPLVIWRAAAIIFFGLSVYLLVSDRAVEKREVSKMQGELRDIESFYGNQIAEKVAFIDRLDDTYEDDQFAQDIGKLDAMYEVLREEMKTSPSAKVKDALILNMLIRIDLLNQQIKKLEDNQKSETDESI